MRDLLFLLFVKNQLFIVKLKKLKSLYLEYKYIKLFAYYRVVLSSEKKYLQVFGTVQKVCEKID